MASRQLTKNERRRRKRRRRRIINIILLLIIVVLIAAIVVATAASKLLNKVGRDELDSSANLYQNQVEGYTNILLLGVDTRDMSDVENSRTDAIMIASINNSTDEITLTSIYRDTYLQMGDTTTYDKITHAHYYGSTEMSIASINRAMDLDIDQYVMMNFKGVADAIDEMGGITVNVKDYEIEELNKYTVETAKIIGRKNYGLATKAGKQTLDGCQAVSYGRIRKGVGDDYARTGRMRIVFKKVLAKSKKMGPTKLYKVAAAILPEMKTNLSNREMLDLALKLQKLSVNSSKGFPYNKTAGMINGVSYVQATDLAADVTTFHQKVLGQSNYTPSSTVQEISSQVSASSSY